MMLFLCSFLVAFGFNRALIYFPSYINRQIYNDYIYLVKSKMDFDQFCELSCLKPKAKNYGYMFYILCSMVSLLFNNPIIIVVLWVLCFLSLLDIYYLLTDVRYIGLIFILSLIYLITEKQDFYDYLFNLTVIILFFMLFYLVGLWFYKKEMMGNGDVLLFCSLCLFFTLDQMLMLILIACILGILFYFGYLLAKKEKINKLPFIPFISLSSFIMFFLV